LLWFYGQTKRTFPQTSKNPRSVLIRLTIVRLKS